MCAVEDVADPEHLLRIQSRSENLRISRDDRGNGSIIFLLVVFSGLAAETDGADS